VSKFVYLVKVETDRTHGLIASRSEQSDKIIEALQDPYVTIDGIGARGDSTYDVTEVEVYELEDREMKELNAQYDTNVERSKPTDNALRADIREALADRDKYKDLYETQKAIVDQLIAGDPHEGSPVYQEPRKWMNDDEPRVNLDPRERVFFQFGDHRSQRFSVQFSNYKDGSIEITADTMGHEFAVMPQSGNVVRIKVLDR